VIEDRACGAAALSYRKHYRGKRSSAAWSPPFLDEFLCRAERRGFRAINQAAMTSVCRTVLPVGGLLMPLRGGIMASGISRTNSILSTPLSKVAPFTS
jgi:hypothetical protein